MKEHKEKVTVIAVNFICSLEGGGTTNSQMNVMKRQFFFFAAVKVVL